MMVQLKKFSLCFAKIEDVRNAVEARCVFLRTASPVADISLLRDVADALKHHSPDRPSATVLASTDVATVSMGFGQMRFGEGKSMASSRSSSQKRWRHAWTDVGVAERLRRLDDVAQAAAVAD